ncbi:MAG: MurR/RpiR family transcriptional regulator [Pseudomonadota bacterium]
MTESTRLAAEPPSDLPSLNAAIARHSPTLAPRLRQCAQFVLDNPDKVALGTTAEIADIANVQPSTLVRFAQALGFSGFSEMQDLLKANLLERGYSYEHRLHRMAPAKLSSPRRIFEGFVGNAHAALETALDEIDAEAMDRVVRIMTKARSVHFLGLRRSFPAASALFYALSKMGKPCTLLDSLGGMLGNQGAFISPRDAMFVVTFHPYAPEVIELCETVHRIGCPIVAITDVALSPIEPFATEVLHVRDAALGDFRSLAVTMCLCSALSVAVGKSIERPAADRARG